LSLRSAERRLSPAAPAPLSQGSITIQYRYREEDREFVWDYRSDPPIPDELAVRLLREVADHL